MIAPCKLMEEYSTCAMPEECETTCDLMRNRILMHGCVFDRCLPRCVCKRGFLRNIRGKCVPERVCYPVRKQTYSNRNKFKRPRLSKKELDFYTRLFNADHSHY